MFNLRIHHLKNVKQNLFFEEFTFTEELLFLKMTTRGQKRKAVKELVSRDMKTAITENNPKETLIAGPSKLPKILLESLDDTKTSLSKEIMSDLSKILAETQKEVLQLIAPTSKTQNNFLNIEETDSETKDVLPTAISTSVKVKTGHVKEHR